MDPFTLHVRAGHTDMNTTKRYVHPSEADIGSVGKGSGWAQNWAHRRNLSFYKFSGNHCDQLIGKGLAGATRRNRTGDLLITNQSLYQLS
jgi:hypothetical protein